MAPQKRMRVSSSLMNEVLRSGKSLHGRFFSLKFKKSEKELRFSVVISKKVKSKAAARNLLKRRIYAVISDLFKNNLQKGFFVIFCLPPSDKLQFSEMKEKITALFNETIECRSKLR